MAWLTARARSGTSALVATAQAAHRFPKVMHRLNAGEISLDQTAAIVRTAPDWSDRVMADCASSMTPAQLATTARLHHEADVAAQASEAYGNGPTPPPNPPVRESLQFRSDVAGGFHGRLRLDDDHGVEFEAALRAHLDVLWTQWSAAGGHGPSPRPVDALMRMVRRAAEADMAGLGSTADHRRHLVIMHVDVATRVGTAHMGPVLPHLDHRGMVM